MPSSFAVVGVIVVVGLRVVGVDELVVPVSVVVGGSDARIFFVDWY